jgi:hypothetical protein
MNECNAQRLVRLGLTTAVGTAVGVQGGQCGGWTRALRRLGACSLSRWEAPVAAAHILSKVLVLVTLQIKCTRALNF